MPPQSAPQPSAPKPSVRTSAVRSRIEHASHPVLQRLARLPRFTPLVLFVVLAVLGAVLRGWVGAVCFGVLTVLVAWLLYLSWPRLGSLERLMRLALLLLTAVLTLVTALPR
ncbi:hypothetical protein PZ938_18160 [Luteipulveratus sp. YIM 133132]|uniref:DUF6703 family protein n=1 Tax=Luteipulveratus flavus TaxID=3031728 RepID=UPI0023B052A3|nr:DUF6703 family protein [Luteipulveratus sp. YIM 133132]MDE9367547.1 hypothetical protein [Luteipulveratus sp. YIM 133132]